MTGCLNDLLGRFLTGTSPSALRALVLLAVLAITVAACGESPLDAGPSAKAPNVLWIIADDMSFELGAYGDAAARTPNLDRLAGESMRYSNAFSTSGVCAPSRAAMITGMYATSIGAHHMRSIEGGYEPVPAPEVKTVTEYLRAAGYYASSVGKLDYQFSGVFDGAPLTNWDDPNGSYRGRAPEQPFFAQVTIFDTHESQLFSSRPLTTDPAIVMVPPYYPDTPVVRTDLARHYDNVARLDAKVGEVLAMLDADGISDNTVVFFFADNGRGFPRDKRWVYDGGTHLPLMVRWPGHLAPGTSDELVSYVDLAPTALALAGVDVPAHMPGRVFIGAHRERPPEYVFAAADRHDEAPDRIRLVRDERWAYVRNYHPETPYGQPIAFRDGLATMQEIFRLHDEGLLQPPADWYYRQTKPVEELYDTVADPFQIENLADRPEHQERLARMRAAHERWVVDSGDLGAIPESQLAELYWPGGVQPVTPPPQIAPAGGSFAPRVTVAIDAQTDGASIAYTLDVGDAPRWQLYSQPFKLDRSATVRARAVRYGWAESVEVTQHFEILTR